MRLIITVLIFLVTLSAKADIIGMIKPTIIYAKTENGDTTEMKVEYELWNYFHSQMGHKWTETYYFSPAGILMLSFGDGDWATSKKRRWKNKYELLGNDKLKHYHYKYADETTTYPEANKYLSYTDTVLITDRIYNLVTLKNIKAYINDHSKAFASRDKSFSAENKKVAEKVLEALANEFKDEPKKKEPKPKKSYTWLYISGSILLVLVLSIFLIRKYRKTA